MMLVPSRRNRGLLGMMTDPLEMILDISSSLPRPTPMLMKTDIKENEKDYEMTIDLPGYKKDNISIEVEDGYLTVSASKEGEHEEKDEKGTYIRKERFSGKSSRNFYVGDEVNEDDITAKFEDGILKVTVPKKEQEPEAEEKKKVIAIEG